MTTDFYLRNRSAIRRSGQISMDHINDFFTQLPEPQTPRITKTIEEVQQNVRLPRQTLLQEEQEEYATNPATLFQLACKAVGSDTRTLAVCKDRLPRALVVAVKHFLPLEEYLCFKSTSLKCVSCQVSLHPNARHQCPQCSRLVKKEFIRTLLFTGQL